LKWALAVVLFFTLAAVGLAKDETKEEEPKPAQSIAELQQQLERILGDTHTPGVTVAIVHRAGPEWVAGLGTADVATNRATTADTLFRIGSTSKAFAALSILMLADQGKLSLNDPVHKLAPEVWFENPWEATDPVRVVHLLEHTTGWDDMHLREYAKDWPGSMGLREGLDYDHHSRVSRWRPGTRMAYCNSGPPVAACIVERITGQKFEDFVAQNLFRPIGMNTATYFQPTRPKPRHFTTMTAKLPTRTGTSCCARQDQSTLPQKTWRPIFSSISIVAPRTGSRLYLRPTLIAWNPPQAPGRPKMD
jgi:CubicO group peptidase (beta-lactamase class C family)